MVLLCAIESSGKIIVYSFHVKHFILAVFFTLPTKNGRWNGMSVNRVADFPFFFLQQDAWAWTSIILEQSTSCHWIVSHMLCLSSSVPSGIHQDRPSFTNESVQIAFGPLKELGSGKCFCGAFQWNTCTPMKHMYPLTTVGQVSVHRGVLWSCRN